jgi:hypothetical protein
MIRPLLLAVAALAIAAPAASAHDDDAEIFATNNTAVITDQNDPRLDAPLLGFARRVEDIIRDGGARPRGSRLLDGVFFDSGLGSTTFERSRVFDVDHVSGDELHGIAETVRRRFPAGLRVTFDPESGGGGQGAEAVENPQALEHRVGVGGGEDDVERALARIVGARPWAGCLGRHPREREVSQQLGAERRGAGVPGACEQQRPDAPGHVRTVVEPRPLDVGQSGVREPSSSRWRWACFQTAASITPADASPRRASTRPSHGAL